MKVIPWRRLILIVLVTSITCTSFTLTFQLFLSAYDALVHGLSGGGLIVWDEKARTPITSVIRCEVVDFLKNVLRVESLSPEVLAPCIINGRMLMARGVDPNLFSSFEEFKVVEGRMLEPYDFHKVVLGVRAMKRLNLHLGERVTVLSVLRDVWATLDVVGVISTDSYIDDEIIVLTDVARWLRGLKNEELTIVRVSTNLSLLSPEGFKGVVAEGEVVKFEVTFPNGTKAEHVEIRVEDMVSVKALTDEWGIAYLRLPPGSYDVEFYLGGRRFKETYRVTVSGSLKIDVKLNPEFAEASSEQLSLRTPDTKMLFKMSELSAGRAEELVKRLFESELGLTEDTLKILSALTSIFTLTLSYYVTYTVVSNCKLDVALLRALGSSKRKTLSLMVSTLLKASVLGIASGLGLTMLTVYFINGLNITIIGYSVTITLNAYVLTAASLSLLICNLAGGLKALKDILGKTIAESLQSALFQQEAEHT